MSIQRLPGDVAVQIKSSTTVVSLNDAVLGLLKNALDAGARRVTISVDYSRGGCTVEDDGVGIPPAEFFPNGGLGKRHYTSKYPHSSSIHGRSGTFLASVAALSLLTVFSLCQGHSAPNGITIHNAKVLRRQTPASLRECMSLSSHGTVVAIRDLFGCMPVRARLRPPSDSSPLTRDWDSLVRAVAALLLAWTTDVTVCLKPENSTSTVKRTLRAERSEHGRGDIARTTRILGQACAGEAVEPRSWVSVGASVPGTKITGCVSLAPAASKKMQFLRIGIEPLSKEQLADALPLYDEANKMFADSNFGAAMARKRTASSALRGPMDTFVREQAPRKSVDRWPMFSIGIDLEDDVEVDDVLNDQRRHLAVISSLMRTMFAEFLQVHGFYDEPRTMYGRLDGDGDGREDSEEGQASDSCTSMSPASPLRTKKKTNSTEAAQTRYKIGSRSLASRGKGLRPSVSLFSSWPQTKHSQPQSSKKPAEISSLNTTSQPEMEVTSEFFADSCVHTEMESWDGNTLTSGKMKISRLSLEAAKVVGQVDRKFILLQAPASAGCGPEETAEVVLILVDQHAADERCRVEALLQDYFSMTDTPNSSEATTVMLERPLRFEIDAREQTLLQQSKAFFRHWGIFYEMVPSYSEKGPASERETETLLRVDRLPASIAERCRQDPILVLDLLRKELWERADRQVPSASSSADKDTAWVSRLHGCPRGILDLVNSKACRSAIKFNDPLTHEECVALLGRLLCCSFPFQCAHGRPSMVPVLNLGPAEA